MAAVGKLVHRLGAAVGKLAWRGKRGEGNVVRNKYPTGWLVLLRKRDEMMPDGQRPNRESTIGKTPRIRWAVKRLAWCWSVWSV